MNSHVRWGHIANCDTWRKPRKRNLPVNAIRNTKKEHAAAKAVEEISKIDPLEVQFHTRRLEP